MLIAILLALSGASPPPVPAWAASSHAISAFGEVRCNFALIRGARRVRVRAGPGREYAVIDTLRVGMTVFTCDEARDRRYRHWSGVVYRAPGKPCHGGTRDGLPEHLARHCRSGWIDDRWIEVISG